MTVLEFYKNFPTEKDCEEHFIKLRWGNKENIICTKCNCKKIYVTKQRIPYRCSSCKKSFSVRDNSVLSESNLSLQKWLLAIYLLYFSKKGISSVELSEKVGITQKAAWFLAHRIREFFIETKQIFGVIEIDETFIGGKEKNKHLINRKGIKGTEGKLAVMGAISRDNKQVIAYPVPEVTFDTAQKFITNKIVKNSLLYSDNANCYDGLVPLRVNHTKGEYVRGDIHINSIEGFWAGIKRAYVGVYHYWSKKHLKRYINEFTFRYNNKKNCNILFDKIFSNINNKYLSYKKLTS